MIHQRICRVGLLLCSFYLLGLSNIAAAEETKLHRMSYPLTPELSDQIKTSYLEASDTEHKQGRIYQEGFAKPFLVKNGISFPPGASAVVSGDRLVVSNDVQNLEALEAFLASHYKNATNLPPFQRLCDILKLAPTPTPHETQEPNVDFEILSAQGVTYRKVRVLQTNAAEVKIGHEDGGAVLKLESLNPELQQHFGYNAEAAKEFLKKRKAEVSSVKNKDLDANFKQIDSVDNKTDSEPSFEPSVSAVLPTKQENSVLERSKAIKSEGGKFYDELLTRDGRVLKKIIVVDNKGRRSFKILSGDGADRLLEDLQYWDAPSHLLCDFELFDELFNRALVVRSRAQLYELQGADHVEGKSFQDLAQNAFPGASFVSVPEGFLLSGMNWIRLPVSAVECPRPLAGRRFVATDAGKLVGFSPASDWWNKYVGHTYGELRVPDRLKAQEPSKLGVLYSPFDPQVPILGNTTGEMKRLWTESGPEGGEKQLAVVETGNGYFFGYYKVHSALSDAEITWADALKDKNGRFELVAKNPPKRLSVGDRLLTLFDASARSILGADFKELGQLKLGPQHINSILLRGIEASVQDRLLPQGDGVRFPQDAVDTVSSPALDKVVIVDQISAKLKDMLPHAYIFSVEIKERVIEIRKRNNAGRVKFEESAPLRRTRTEIVEIPPDLDGGLRLTDGKVVYELRPGFSGAELVVWDARPNGLKKL